MFEKIKRFTALRCIFVRKILGISKRKKTVENRSGIIIRYVVRVFVYNTVMRFLFCWRRFTRKSEED